MCTYMCVRLSTPMMLGAHFMLLFCHWLPTFKSVCNCGPSFHQYVCTHALTTVDIQCLCVLCL